MVVVIHYYTSHNALCRLSSVASTGISFALNCHLEVGKLDESVHLEDKQPWRGLPVFYFHLKG